MLWGALACVVVALIGLAARRHAAAVRLAAVLAVAVALAGALDPHRAVPREQRAGVVVVPTASDAAGLEGLAERVQADADWQVVTGAAPPLERWLAAALGADAAAPQQIAIAWNGPFDAAGLVGRFESSAPGSPALRAARGVALTTAPPPLVEPDDCQLRAVGVPEVGRPAAVELEVTRPVPAGLGGVLLARDPAGVELARVDLDRELLQRDGRQRLAFTPAVEGWHALECALEVDGVRIEARGAVTAQPARQVVVAGEGADALVAALEVQGVRARAAATPPPDLADVDVVVALGTLPAEEQDRLQGWVLDGGGLFVVGTAASRLPQPSEPLHALLPVTVREARVAGPEAEAGDGPPGPETDEVDEPPEEPAAEDPAAEIAETDPPEAEDTPPPEPEGPATGDTSGAQLREEQAEVERRNVAIVLLVDRSGSMTLRSAEGVSRIGYAKSSAYQTAKALGEGDLLGVVTFGINGQVALPLTPAPESALIRTSIEGLRAGANRTLLQHGLQVAREMLNAAEAARKVVVVLSDCDIADVRWTFEGLLEARAAHDDGIGVSVIQFGPPDLIAHGKTLADQGGGQVYRADDPSRIPRLVLVEVQKALGALGRGPGDGDAVGDGDSEAGPTATEEPAESDATPDDEPPAPPPDPEPEPLDPPADPPTEPEPQAAVLPVVATTRSPLLEPETPNGFPPVGGVVDVEARPEGLVLLLARRDDEGVPLLAFTNRGLGKVGVWTSGLLGPWGTAWRRDPAFPARLAQWVSALMPPLPDRGPLDLLTERTLAPPAPVRAERDALERFAGSPLQSIDAFVPPEPTVVEEQESLAPPLGLAALLAVVLLALVEYCADRWRR
ncbi:MAG: VWA domain-containing protein [Planctomycetota bacterium]